MTRDQAEVLVIGAGVSGLSTATWLAESGVRIAVCAAEPPQATTSAVAGALWGPHLVGMDGRVTQWGLQTREMLTALAADQPDCIRLASGIGASRQPEAAPPDWAAGSAGRCAADELPAGYLAGWRLAAPIVWMPGYLEYLSARYLAAGGAPVQIMEFGTLADAAGVSTAPVIVNCTGTGAAALVPDPSVTAVRGQIVVVSNPGISEFFVGTGPGENDLTYLFPHGDNLVLGGTEQAGNWSREPSPEVGERIVAACTQVRPAISGATVLAHRVGLRPARPSVRLDIEPLAGTGRQVVHNYGHGGAGVSLSWGCAIAAAELAMAALG